MNKNDFELTQTAVNRGVRDYYFKISGSSCNELSDKYDAGSNMKGIFRLAYTPETETIALFRTFFFKEDYVIVIDDELKELLCTISRYARSDRRERMCKAILIK